MASDLALTQCIYPEDEEVAIACRESRRLFCNPLRMRRRNSVVGFSALIIIRRISITIISINSRPEKASSAGRRCKADGCDKNIELSRMSAAGRQTWTDNRNTQILEATKITTSWVLFGSLYRCLLCPPVLDRSLYRLEAYPRFDVILRILPAFDWKRFYGVEFSLQNQIADSEPSEADLVGLRAWFVGIIKLKTDDAHGRNNILRATLRVELRWTRSPSVQVRSE